MLTADSIDQFLRSISENGMSPNTVRAYKADLNGLLETMDRAGLKPTTWGELESMTKAYLNVGRETWEPRTTNRKASSLRSWAEWAGNPGFLARYRAPKPAKPQPHPIPEGVPGIMRMVAVAATDEQRFIVALCGLAGLRIHEVLLVRPCDFDEVEGTLKVHGKGDKWRVVPISNKCWSVISQIVMETLPADTTPFLSMNERTARRILTRLADAANLSRRVASHDLRSTFATAAYKKTGDLRAVQELLGHADSRTTEVYTGISMDAMREAADVA